MKKRTAEILIALAAVGLIAAGLAMIYWPLAPIWVGLVLLAELLTGRGRP